MKTSHPDYDTVFDREAHDALLEGIAPIEPAPERGSALFGRISARVAADRRESAGLLTIRADEGRWKPYAPGVQVKRLLRGNDVIADLVKLEPGARIPGHEHHQDEECICLQGEVYLGDLHIRAGDFHFAPRGRAHGEIYSPTGCLLYVRTARATRRANRATARRVA